MSQEFKFWTHGVATILESPERAKLVVHNGLGTTVEQDAGTNAWFHIPIPTPNMLESDSTIYLRKIALAVKVNENAKVDMVHVRRGPSLIVNQPTSFIGTTVNWEFDNPDASTSVAAGVTLCVHVQFLSGTPRGRIDFYGAGATFS